MNVLSYRGVQTKHYLYSHTNRVVLTRKLLIILNKQRRLSFPYFLDKSTATLFQRVYSYTVSDHARSTNMLSLYKLVHLSLYS